MCGIIGYVGNQPAKDIILSGLKRLEYRGYDSSGISILEGGTFHRIRALGEVNNLTSQVPTLSEGLIGIGHTRWATHGGVTLDNTHPHISFDGKFSLVHNGIVENYLRLKKEMTSSGISFYSQTDTEVLVNYIAYLAQKHQLTPENALRQALTQVEGTYGVAMLHRDTPQIIFAARKGSPLILGVGINEMFVASDAMAITRYTNTVVYLADGELAVVCPQNFKISQGNEVINAITVQVNSHALDTELEGYKYYMEKEVFTQGTALSNTLRGRISGCKTTAKFGGLNLDVKALRTVDQIFITGCGTAWHAGLITKHFMERYARINVEVDVSSEFRYRQPPLQEHALALFFSQSGETVDTLACLREFKRRGVSCLGIVNAVGSTIAREVDGGVYQHVGVEIGVASTKAFTSQVLLGALLSIYFGRLHDLNAQQGALLIRALEQVPELINATLKIHNHIESIVKKYLHVKDFMFLGRQSLYPVALESALKLKEIAYVNATGYAAAEMKHGPIAMIHPNCPSMFFAPNDELLTKNISSMQEIKARGGPIIIVTHPEVELPAGLADDRIDVPHGLDPVVDPILFVIPGQLFAYYFAHLSGYNVDRPKNLAKSVTVE